MTTDGGNQPGFCADDFWNLNLTWKTSSPDFSHCFQQTVLVILPCCVFSVCAMANIWVRMRRPKLHQMPWLLTTVSKSFLCIALACISIAELLLFIYQKNTGLSIPDVLLYSNASKILAYIFALALVVVNKICAVKSSAVLTVFWFVMSLCGIIMFRSILVDVFNEEWDGNSEILYILEMVYFPLVFCQFFLSLFSDVVSVKTAQDPFEDVPFFSFLTFHWVNFYIFQGAKNLLTVDDFAPLPARLRADHLWKKFVKKWKEAFRRGSSEEDHTQKKKASGLKLACILIKTYLHNFTYTIIFHLVYVAMKFLPPLLLDALIAYMSTNDYLWKGVFYAVVLFVADFCGGISHALSMFYSECFSLQAKSSLVSAVYRKAIKLSSFSRQGYTCGEMVNLMSVDIEKIADFCSYYGYLFGSPVKIIVSLFLLWQYLGPSCLAGVLVMFILLGANSFVIKKGADVQLIASASANEELCGKSCCNSEKVEQMSTKDSRLNFLTEVISGIKVLKLYAWETPFMKKITDIRKTEVRLIRIFQFCCAACDFVWGCAPFLIAVVCFTTFILVDEKNVLDPAVAFVSLNLLNILRYAVMDLPILSSDVIQVSVSLKRLSKFLVAEEYDKNLIGNKPDKGEAVSVRDATFSWSPCGEPTLQDISIHAPRGSLIAIIGQVGSGKSSILSAILGEMYKTSGSVDVEGSFAYVPQQAWILNRTLKDNILFVKPMDKKKYAKVLDVCCLKPDLEILPGGDNTEIGEKGVNLSGGQKQRISIARAVYQDADIYLLDDPLSAVDAHVGKHIFEHVIGKNGILKRKTRLFVTHNVSSLHQADYIYVMKGGRIEEKGSYSELMASGGLFADLIQEYANVNSHAEAGDPVLAGGEEPLSPLPLVERSLSVQTLRSRTISVDSSSSKAGAALVEEEKMQVGKVKKEAFLDYARHMGVPVLLCVIFGYLGREAFEIGTNVWLSKWSSDPPLPGGSQDIPLRNKRIGVYAALGLCECVAIAFGSLAMAFGAARASRLFHNIMLDSVIKSPMSFFDTTPLGRIVNRFGRDIDDIDTQIPQELDGWLICLFSAAGTFIVIGSSTPLFLAFLFPMLIIYYFIQKVYLITSRQLKRLLSIARSPLYSHFTETVQGISSIRSYRVESQFSTKCENKLDANVMYRFYWTATNRWLEIRLAAIGDIVVFIAAILAVTSRDYLEASVAALSLTYALSVNEMLNWLVRTGTELENKSISVERVSEYSKLPSEAPWNLPGHFLPPRWPEAGNIEFRDYSTRYREGLNLSLQDVNLNISDSEKVGVVGRTGAGKSSLTLALFRIIEPASGSITIDKIDVSKIGLHQLRSKLTIIPQDPVLFTGNLRINLDPDDNHSDADIWSSLEHANLKSFVESLPEGLFHEITEGGGNLSVGQRQLVCLARALLKKSRILILDEATAAVDMETDQLIQNTIRKEFKNNTVITIAHRLNTVMDYDRIVVMKAGKVAEVGPPSDLLQNENSEFFSMAKDAGLI